MNYDFCYRKDNGIIIVCKNEGSVWSDKEKGLETANEFGLFFSVVTLGVSSFPGFDQTDVSGKYKVNDINNPTSLVAV